MVVPKCKHWILGGCLYAEKCRFRHDPLDRPATRKPPPRKAGGARGRCKNKHAPSHFRRFLLKTFGGAFLRSGVILDVAGGNGRLAMELANISDMEVVVVDPRPEMDVEHWERQLKGGYFHRNEILNKFNYNTTEIILSRGITTPHHYRLFFEPMLWVNSDGSSEACDDSTDKESKIAGGGGEGEEEEGTKSRTKLELYQGNCERANSITWTKKGLVAKKDVESDTVYEKSSFAKSYTSVQPSLDVLEQTLSDCVCVVGLHPDQATGAIVDFALAHSLPFAVVPCCVYSREFTRRTLQDGASVKSYDQLIAWLLEKDPSIKLGELPSQGKNVVVYSLGGDSVVGKERGLPRAAKDDIRPKGGEVRKSA
eukprot:TRINITY_DN12350_c0_g1_i1.p1 TRINITY_DN12350_c0_g1~~TRINITY_DN12350_c0_g1_i1.p1  ORF type:complete len:400 (+),score=72.84 TRINITY_DN12350_c0_g1_i1:97-1200(+)